MFDFDKDEYQEEEQEKEIVYDEQYKQDVEVITKFHCILEDGTHMYEF